MRFAQISVVAMASAASAQLVTETVLTTPDVATLLPSNIASEIPTPTGDVLSQITSAIGEASDAIDQATSSLGDLEGALSSAISESIAQSIEESISADVSSLMDILSTATDSSIIASVSDAINDATQTSTGTDDGNFAARPTGAFAAGALLGGAAILANL